MTVVTDTTPVRPPWWWGFAKPIATGAERHLISAAGGALVGLGVVLPGNQAKFEEIAAGAIAWAVGYWWSNYSHHVKTAQIDAAKAQVAAVQANNRAIVAQTQQVLRTDVPL